MSAVLARPEVTVLNADAELAGLRAEVAKVRAQLAALRRAHDALDCDIVRVGLAAGRALELAADIEYRSALAVGGAA